MPQERRGAAPCPGALALLSLALCCSEALRVGLRKSFGRSLAQVQLAQLQQGQNCLELAGLEGSTLGTGLAYRPPGQKPWKLEPRPSHALGVRKLLVEKGYQVPLGKSPGEGAKAHQAGVAERLTASPTTGGQLPTSVPRSEALSPVFRGRGSHSAPQDP